MKQVVVRRGSLIVVSLMFLACGGSQDNGTKTNLVEQDNYSIAVDNAVKKVSAEFNDYKVVVYTDKVLNDNPAQSTKAIYGKIDGESTTSLLSVSDKYTDGDSFIVKVYNKNDTLVGQSKKAVLEGDFLEFSDIQIKGE
jgi:hypothetical protein